MIEISGNTPLGSALKAEHIRSGEWSDSLPVLAAHGILPLLYWRISALPAEISPPEDITDRMRQISLAGLANTVLMERQLGEVIEGFKKAEVPMLVLKGPGLASSIYPNPSLRPSVDIDLLVPPERMRQSRTVLERLNYHLLGSMFDSYQDIFCDEQFIHQKNPRANRPIEIHWHLHPSFGSVRHEKVEEFFLRAVEVEKPPLAFRTLHPVDALIHGAIHLTMHHNREMRLIWVVDIALLARTLKVPDDWVALQERSIEWQARLAVEHSLKLAEMWAGLQLPDGVGRFASWPEPKAPERIAWKNATLRHERWTALLRLHVPGSTGVVRQIRSLLRLVFPHPDRIRETYPPPHDWLLPVSYIRRWLRWMV
jgi:hypothetical protein